MLSEPKSRPRHVVFRISDQEHQYLSDTCEVMGFRSLSELVRQAVFHYASTRRRGRTLLTDDLGTVTMRLEELEKTLADLSNVVGRILGSHPRAARVEAGASRDAMTPEHMAD